MQNNGWEVLCEICDIWQNLLLSFTYKWSSVSGPDVSQSPRGMAAWKFERNLEGAMSMKKKKIFVSDQTYEPLIFNDALLFSDGNYFFHRWSMLTSGLFNIGQRLWIICVKLFNAKYSVHISRIRSSNEQPIHFPDHWEQRWWLKKNGNKLPESRPPSNFLPPPH